MGSSLLKSLGGGVGANIGDLFKTPKPETFVVDPLASQKTTAADFLESLISRPVPREGVAPLSGTEQFGQEELDRYVRSGLPAGLQQSGDYFNKILNQPTDITQLPEYQAILKSIGAETSDATNRAFRRTRIAGMPTSGAQGRAVGKEIARGGDRLLANLAPFAEAERGRQGNAASMLAELSRLREQLQQGRFASLQQFGGLPRQLQQFDLSSLFNQRMSPFRTKAPIAQGLIGQGIDYTVQQDPSIMEQLAPLIQAGAQAFAASDRRVKENIEDLGDSVRKVKKIRAKTYNYKGTDPSELRVGVIAQDVEKVLPGAVKVINGIKFVDYAAITALATQAVNELIKEVEKLKKKVA